MKKTCYRWLIISIVSTLMLISNSHANLPTLGDPTLDSFSSKEEQELGRAFYRSLRANLVFIDDLQINDYLENLGLRLASHSDAAGGKFRFFIIKSPTINAFAGPAGHIGIHTELILKAENESQLAGVLAHEIAHVSQRHLARAFDNSGQTTALTIATLLAAILIGTQDSQAGHAVLLSGLAGNIQSSINFTRSNEYEADRIGIGMLTDAGINPMGMVEFFEILLNKSPDGGMEYLRTHPLSSNRVAEAKNRLSEESADLPNDSLDFQLAKARLAILLSKQPEHYLDAEFVGNELIGKYQKALAAIRLHKADLAIEILHQLLQKNQHPWLRLALAEAYTVNKNDDKSLQILSALAKLYPGYLPVTMAYAHALNRNNIPEKSIALLKKQLQIHDDAIIHKTLARSYFINGQVSAALESTGNQYARQGYIELAIQQYDNAMQQENISQSTRSRLESAKKNLKEIVKQRKN